MKLWQFVPYVILFFGVHLLISWASWASLPTASFILYGDAAYLPTVVTIAVDSVVFLTLITSPWWVPFLMKFVPKEES